MRYLNDLLERPGSEHWGFPIAYNFAGAGMYSLSEILTMRPAIKSPRKLSDNEWRELILSRMRMHSAYQMACPDGFVGTPEQAVEAIESRSTLGQRIIDDQREYVTS